MNQQLKKIWICHDVLMDILPFFERVELGLTLAMVSDRFDLLVDAHFDGKSELTIMNCIIIMKGIAEPKAKLFVGKDNKPVAFPWPDDPLPNKIRFRFLWISHIDHAVVEFLCANQQIWDKGSNLYMHLQSYKIKSNVQPIWDVFVREIWPIFTTTNVHHLGFDNADLLDTFLRLTSLTILSDFNINSIQFRRFPEAIVDSDGPNATPTTGQLLSKWLHTPTTDGRPKKLRCLFSSNQQTNLEWINNFKKIFRHATSSVSYKINFGLLSSTSIEPFEVKNERTNEKLTMEKDSSHSGNWLMKRCPTETATIQLKDENLDANLNNIYFMLSIDTNCVGPLAPSAEEKDGQSNGKVFSTTLGPSDQRNE